MIGGTSNERTPLHYAAGPGQLQPFDVIDAWGLNFYEGNVVKYLRRWKDKGGLEDLTKAQHYLEEAIRRAIAAQAREVRAEIARERRL